MPHFVIDCSPNVIASIPVEIFYKEIFYSAAQTGLFDPDDIKVRLRPFEHYDVGNMRKDFIHVCTLWKGERRSRRPIYPVGWLRN